MLELGGGVLVIAVVILVTFAVVGILSPPEP